jgi:hypothetical protein
MKMDDVVDDAGNLLPFDDIRNKFAIPNEISGYKKVTVGKGVELLKGEANGGGGFEGGGTQYQITGGKENVVYE